MIRILVTDEHDSGYTIVMRKDAVSVFPHNEEYYHVIDAWAQEHCVSYMGFCVTDVKTLFRYSGTKLVGYYEFRDEPDAILFILRWPGARLYH